MSPANEEKTRRAPTVWARISEPVREPRQVLTRDRIVDSAIRLADREGLDAVSMRKLADELETSPMSLYRHVHGRDDLLELMYDSVIAPDRDLRHSGDWRRDLHVVARNIRDVALAHPWATRMMTSGRPAFGPNALLGLEWALAAVAGLGLPIADMSRMVLTVIGVAQATAQTEVGEVDEQQRTGLSEADWHESMAPYLNQVLESGDYPQVATMLAVSHEQDPEAIFDTTLGIVLDGLEQYVDQRRAAAAGD
ncbi:MULTISPECIES: TetR/AcrR family transcriptional regulator [Amycolatopsis]|uniref:TetR/AcrR family transcriptional regulator n=1 Tax=Amycolatopsis sp. cg13 TaxID=3238807 RepID=UPI003523E882